MPLPFIIAAGVALVAAGYGVKKKVDADILSEETNEYIKYINEGNDLLEEAEEVIKAVASDCEFALARFEEKRCYIRNHVISEFLHHFNQLEGFELTNKKDSMENIQLDVSNTLKIIDKNLKMSSFDTLGAVGNVVGGFSMGFGLAAGGIVGSVGLLAGPTLAIFGALRAAEMEKKLEDAKAYCSQVEAAVKKADAMIDNLQAVRKMADLFTRQITKFDALFFSLAQEAIATMKKHNYDFSHYNQKEQDQLATASSTLKTLGAFLKVPIMDKHQKLNEATQSKLEFMQREMSSLEAKHYDSVKIKFGLVRRLFEFFRSLWGKNGRIQRAKTTPDRFPCTSCGLCCKNIAGIIELIGFDAGNGVCKFLDLETNLCKIYESRPLICRIDEAHKKLYPHIPLKEFYAKNAEVCNALQEANHMDKSFRVILKK